MIGRPIWGVFAFLAAAVVLSGSSAAGASRGVSTPAVTTTSVSAGADHTCAITSGGGAKCWGSNGFGRLGDGTTTDRSTPVDVSGLSSGVTAIAAGGLHTCALTSGGGVKCWGNNSDGQLGDGTTTNHPTPVDVSGLTSGVTAISIGYYHSCALTSGGGVKCWGDNFFGELGDNGSCGLECATPVTPTGLGSGVTAIAAGGGVTTTGSSTCALLSTGEVKCWGSNNNGQLGDNQACGSIVCSTPQNVTGLSGITAIGMGSIHACAVTGTAGAKCWGDNFYGQLGDGTTTDRPTPVDVGSLSSVSALRLGLGHSCALTTGGGLKCWGGNFSGQLGDGTTTDHSAPMDVPGLTSGVSAFGAGRAHTCAVVDINLRCWGSNSSGQLGIGTTVVRTTPIDVSGLSGGLTITGGQFHTCSVTGGGGAKCWGGNGNGQLGDGTTRSRPTPTDVTGLTSGVSASVAGGEHSCAVVGGGAKCWGANYGGQLGEGKTCGGFPGDDCKTPVDVSGLSSGVSAITAGTSHSCAIVGGGARCWGQNGSGQIGDGTTDDRDMPVSVSGLSSGVSAIDAGDAHTCAVVSGGAKCWGANGTGQLGDGESCGTSCPTPVNVSGLTSGVSVIAAGDYHTCALTTGGAVKCWGSNGNGQLGDGTTNDSPVPVQVTGLTSGVQAIAAGGNHTCALTNGGGVKCWGDNFYGQVGDGTTSDRTTPVNVFGLGSGVSGIAAGSGHTCALTSSGSAKCWGSNYTGQLGDATGLTPTNVVFVFRALTVAKAGAGTGTVSSGPSGIYCGSTCSGSFPDGSSVTLIADPAAGSSFSGWSGDCSGTGTCTLTMSADHSATATFTLPLRTLTVTKGGGGAGTVTSSPTGIDCGSTCTHDFTDGTTVTLTAAAAAGSSFTGWSGDCSGTGTCQLTMSAAHAATATFESDKTLTVAKAGSGGGTVTSSPAGIDCGSTCSHAYTHGTSVTLTATAGSSSSFSGWSGDCSGSGTCTLTMSANHAATATFQANVSPPPPPPPPVKCVVPKLKGKTLAAAKSAIKKAHCSLGKVKKAYSSRVKKGRVISQKPRPGTKLAKGGKVNLVLSRGKK